MTRGVLRRFVILSPDGEDELFDLIWLDQFYLDCQEDQLKKGMKPGDAGFGIEPEDRHGK